MTIRQLTSVAILIGALTLGACSKDDEDDKVNDNDLHEYVDLGLPSGTLWATCNVGANKRLVIEVIQPTAISLTGLPTNGVRVQKTR